MNRYAYVATGPDGTRTSGVQKAADADSAVLALYERELRDIELTEKKSVLQLELTAPRVKREVVMHLSRQLGAFVRAGLPLIDAVRILGDEAANSTVARMLRQVEQGLRGGERLSDCIDRHPKVFPEFYREILRSAELSGQLDVVLDQLANYLERDLEARRRIKAAMIYPAMIALMSVVTVVVLATFVLPRFKTFFASLHATLPLPTRILLAITDFLGSWWWALLGGVLALGLLYFAVVRTPSGRYARDRVVLSLPAIGPTVRHALVERFCRILSSMVSAGVPLPEALRVATESLRNRVFMRALGRVGEAVLEGEGLARPLAGSGLLPVTAAQMIRVGEDTGTLDTQLEVTAQYYEGELDYRLKKLTALFEPAVIVVMGLLVGFVAVALVSAMYGIFNQVHV
ncbi:MAG TPA: type II secretion system F family protein [Amycolatopsis sp.]|uniref:Type II secretion system F family protein n=1 Tax=Amycolatopsis nalaikhensis TaxID=715472 RepID=A0ABY8XF41_9PSEU|nr:type II secretion system F family protein [Amycolatopsis sp. 2-2]WIV54220.1 type II secretion system F family protein [Amycolatopsis sp. 2-2]